MMSRLYPGTQGAQGNGADLSREEARVHPQSPVNHLLVEGVHSLCGVLSEKCPHSLESLNTSLPIGGSVWEF